MLIEGFGIKGFRSFGEQMQWIYPCANINIFVGTNNAGKSNLLQFITRFYRQYINFIQSGSGPLPTFHDDDEHDMGENPVTFEVGVPSSYLEMSMYGNLRGELFDLLKQLVLSPLLHPMVSVDSKIFLRYEQTQNQFTLSRKLLQKIAQEFATNQISDLCLALTQSSSGAVGTGSENVKRILDKIIRPPNPIGKVVLVPAFREFNRSTVVQSISDELFETVDGRGLRDKLGILERPDAANQHQKQQFNKIEEFVREVVGDLTARIEVPRVGESILIILNGQTRNLTSLGTGINQVVMLAVAATVYENRVLCLEEPEVHLHPELQRRLVRYLEKTNNQYFIATHSAHIIDTPGAHIFHVALETEGSVVTLAKLDKDRSAICTRLGYRASDLVQTNCIIWVEGPSDRIYLRHWIQSLDPSLEEGINYSIMFYGGRIQSHLSALDVDELDPELENLISLRRLSRHAGIIMDSDKESDTQVLNETKQRLNEEFNNSGGFTWITDGRTIEHYIDGDIFHEAARAVHPKSKVSGKPQSKFENILKRSTKNNSPADVNKVAIAEHITANHDANLDVLDLDEKVKMVVDFIRKANGIGTESDSETCSECGQTISG